MLDLQCVSEMAPVSANGSKSGKNATELMEPGGKLYLASRSASLFGH